MNVNIVTTIDDLTEISSTNREGLYGILKINRNSNTVEAKKFLKNFVKEIDEGDYDYFSKNTNLVRIEAKYSKRDVRILKARRIKEHAPILGIKIKRHRTEYTLYYDVSTILKDSTIDLAENIDCIISKMESSYKRKGPNLFSVQAEKEGKRWILSQREIRSPDPIVGSMIYQEGIKYVLLYAMRR
jgi:hypothetical protein